MKRTILPKFISIVAIFLIVFATGCNKNDRSLNIFSIEDDKELGAQLDQQIASDPSTYPILSEAQYPQAYQHLRRIRDKILNSGNVYYKDEFEWQVKIINDDNTLNAFCAPGGYIYVYTGIIKYLETEDQFAGVLAHEIAHADRRHSTDQMTKVYGIETLLSLVLGTNQNVLTQIAEGLLTLKFSRSNEEEADEYSVRYLCPTDYNAAGAAGFFQKMLDNGDGTGPAEFLSTHPSPDNRVQDINAQKSELSCSGTATYDSQYQDFKNSLP
ncbi:MAG: M48 family metalloprotease [Chitinophagales bacterium]|nr:M48 family metalloprotease [Chitinophagales bacterium]